MAKNRNQASLRTKASRIGGTTIILSIILIGILSSQKNLNLDTQEEVFAPAEVNKDLSASTENFEAQMNTESTESLRESEASTSTTTLAQKNQTKSVSAAPKSVTAPMQTSSMVQYSSMNAMLEGNKGKVVWKTMAQRHIKQFEIERSIDDETYESLGVLEGAGQGEHMEEKLYEFVDSKLAMVQMPRVYYRIKQVGFDGLVAYSDIMEYDFGLDLGLYARIEDKSQGKFRVTYAADKTGPVKMRLLDVAGQVIESRELAADFDPQLLAIDAKEWKDGKYFLQLEDKETSVMEQFYYKN